MAAPARIERSGDGLSKLELAALMLARADTIEAVVGVMADAKALRELVEGVDESGYLSRRCSELWVRAQRKAGAMLAVEDIHAGRPNADSQSALRELGIAQHQSSRWQRIASVPDDDFERYVTDAHQKQREITAAALINLARLLAGSDPVARPPLQLVKDDSAGLPGLNTYDYGAIVADPPWQYDNKSTRNAAAKHYPTMTVAELCELDVAAHASAKSHLYLWTTNQFLRDAFDVLDAWGFTYKAHLVWVKPQMGMGNYFRISHEHILFGIRGGLRTRERNVMSWFEADRLDHSQKPDRIFDIIEKQSPGRYLEMFGRRRRLSDEWDYWGNEA